MNKNYLLAGVVSRTFSFRGEVVIRHVLDSIEMFKKLEKLFLDGERRNRDENFISILEIESVKSVKNGAAVKFKGIETEEDAVKLIGKELYFLKSDINLPEGKFFIDDLLNLEVFDLETGKKYGVLAEVTDNGAQQIFRVETVKGYFLVPNVGQFIKRISPDEGIFVSLIDGMTDGLEL